MKKRFNGFTLIELIVVIAIIGILAAILVPSMLGYVKKSKQTAANGNAQTIFKQLMTSAIELDEQDIVMGANGSFKLSDSGITGDVGDCVDMNVWLSSAGFSESQRQVFGEKGGYVDIIYSGGYPISVAWSSSKDGGQPIGRYPDSVGRDDGTTWANWDDDVEI